MFQRVTDYKFPHSNKFNHDIFYFRLRLRTILLQQVPTKVFISPHHEVPFQVVRNRGEMYLEAEIQCQVTLDLFLLFTNKHQIKMDNQ